MAAGRRVVAVELQGHGRTADVDRPFPWDALSDDVAALVRHPDLGPADLMGCPLGGGVCLRAAGWDGAGRPTSRLAVLPGRTHHDVSPSPELAGVVDGFLG
ncbi:alpha/beta fold hydrolase [Geodermatophilus sp. SYSU D00779]